MRKARKEVPAVLAEGDTDDMLPEYNFSRARPNKYASRYKQGGLVVTLEPGVAAVFSTAGEANDALRPLARIILAKQRQRAKHKGSDNPSLQPTGSACG